MANKFENVPSNTDEQKPEDLEAGRLSEKDAQDEANVVRALEEGQSGRENYITIGIPSGKVERIWTEETTTGDYNRAFEAIQQLKKLAEEEPATKKILYKVGRIIHDVGKVPGAMLSALLHNVESGGEGRIDAFLTDAEEALRILKERGEESSREGEKETKKAT